MLLGRLIRSTVTQLSWHWRNMTIMFDHLPLRPIWVNDHSTILAIASCRRTSTFHWADNRPLVLPPHEAFGFVIDHYAVFDRVIMPMWMWLSICVQAVGIEEISHPVSSRDQTVMLYHVATSNTYNTLAERNKITAWLDQRHISNDLQRAVDEKAGSPEYYLSRCTPVSLAMFLVVMKEGRSLDNYGEWLELESPSIHSPFATHHTFLPEFIDFIVTHRTADFAPPFISFLTDNTRSGSSPFTSSKSTPSLCPKRHCRNRCRRKRISFVM
ncbi:hypothetical protein B0H14DRAFT_2694009, partial [Mycena olivaceomarginata]